MPSDLEQAFRTASDLIPVMPRMKQLVGSQWVTIAPGLLSYESQGSKDMCISSHVTLQI